MRVRVQDWFVAKERHELWGEAIRDIGILFLVFAPLDTLLVTTDRRWWDWLMALGLAIAGYAFIEKGVRMESET
jgi:hypothetical protein